MAEEKKAKGGTAKAPPKASASKAQAAKAPPKAQVPKAPVPKAKSAAKAESAKAAPKAQQDKAAAKQAEAPKAPKAPKVKVPKPPMVRIPPPRTPLTRAETVKARAAAQPALGPKVKVRLVRSGVGTPQDQRATLTGLGLSRINQERELLDSPALQGMLFKVRHLVSVNGQPAA